MSGRSSDHSVSRSAGTDTQSADPEESDWTVEYGGMDEETEGQTILDGIGKSIVAAAQSRSLELLAQAREAAFKIESSIEGREVDGTLWTAAVAEVLERGWVRYAESLAELVESARQDSEDESEDKPRDLAKTLQKWSKLQEWAHALDWTTRQVSAPGWSLVANIHPDGEIRDRLPGKG